MLNKNSTKQEVYDELIRISERGGFPCVNDDGLNCRYRRDGRACAIGLFLPDAIAEELDTRKHNEVSSNYEEVKQYFPDWMTMRFAATIQTAHDCLAEKWDHETFKQDLTQLLL